MPSRNDITGDSIVTKKTGDSFRDGWDRIFGKKEQLEKEKEDDAKDSTTEESNG